MIKEKCGGWLGPRRLRCERVRGTFTFIPWSFNHRIAAISARVIPPTKNNKVGTSDLGAPPSSCGMSNSPLTSMRAMSFSAPKAADVAFDAEDAKADAVDDSDGIEGLDATVPLLPLLYGVLDPAYVAPVLVYEGVALGVALGVVVGLGMCSVLVNRYTGPGIISITALISYFDHHHEKHHCSSNEIGTRVMINF